jgi:hypothetical protein
MDVASFLCAGFSLIISSLALQITPSQKKEGEIGRRRGAGLFLPLFSFGAAAGGSLANALPFVSISQIWYPLGKVATSL